MRPYKGAGGGAMVPAHPRHTHSLPTPSLPSLPCPGETLIRPANDVRQGNRQLFSRVAAPSSRCRLHLHPKLMLKQSGDGRRRTSFAVLLLGCRVVVGWISSRAG